MDNDSENEIAALEREIAELGQDLVRNSAKIRHLMDSEDPKAGVCFPKEIFEAHQEKLRLTYEMDLRRARINRLHFAAQA
jgi:hypothetical protein